MYKEEASQTSTLNNDQIWFPGLNLSVDLHNENYILALKKLK